MPTLARLIGHRCEQQRQLAALLSELHFLKSTNESSRVAVDRDPASLVRELAALGRGCLRVFDAFDALGAEVLASRSRGTGGATGGGGGEDEAHLGDYCIVSAVAGCVAARTAENVRRALCAARGREGADGGGADDELARLSSRLRKSLSVKIEALAYRSGGGAPWTPLSGLGGRAMALWGDGELASDLVSIETEGHIGTALLYDLAETAGSYRCQIPARLLP